MGVVRDSASPRADCKLTRCAPAVAHVRAGLARVAVRPDVTAASAAAKADRRGAGPTAPRRAGSPDTSRSRARGRACRRRRTTYRCARPGRAGQGPAARCGPRCSRLPSRLQRARGPPRVEYPITRGAAAAPLTASWPCLPCRCRPGARRRVAAPATVTAATTTTRRPVASQPAPRPRCRTDTGGPQRL